MQEKLKVIVPISIESDWPTKESVIEQILEQKERFGITRFALAGPCAGWRGVGYPPRARFEALARLFAEVRDALAPRGVTCGWWVTTTVKSGRNPAFQPVVKADGEAHPFANCPLDPAFQERFAADVARFAEIARPAFIFTEDDFSVSAAGGCFCPLHLAEFAERMGRAYTREEIARRVGAYSPSDGAEGVEFARAWRRLKHDTMVGISEAVRRALDRKTPEIPMGYMQSGAADADGDTTEDISRALAGAGHVPFCRLAGASYGGVDVKRIPQFTFHAVYNKEHIPGPFDALIEADTFPHTRFFMAGGEMKAIMATVFSRGFSSATFQTQQMLDDPNEERAYGDMYAAERRRFDAVHGLAAQCDPKGAELGYDPFWNTFDLSVSDHRPLWLESLSHFGVPYTTLPSPVAFWDVRQAAHADEAEVLGKLSKGLFLDGDAARVLCERGFGEHLGVRVSGEDLSDGMVRWDLGAREIVRAPFAGRGRNMPSAHMYSPPGNGKWLRMTVTDGRCEVLSDAFTFEQKCLGPAMTRFENRLGGRVAVMGLTLDKNRSQALKNYRRQRLVQDLMVWMGGEPAFVSGAPMVEVVMNEARDPGASGFIGMLTLVNLCADPLPEVKLHLPERWRAAERLAEIDRSGRLRPLAFGKTADGVVIRKRLAYLDPLYVVFR